MAFNLESRLFGVLSCAKIRTNWIFLLEGYSSVRSNVLLRRRRLFCSFVFTNEIIGESREHDSFIAMNGRRFSKFIIALCEQPKRWTIWRTFQRSRTWLYVFSTHFNQFHIDSFAFDRSSYMIFYLFSAACNMLFLYWWGPIQYGLVGQLIGPGVHSLARVLRVTRIISYSKATVEYAEKILCADNSWIIKSNTRIAYWTYSYVLYMYRV